MRTPSSRRRWLGRVLVLVLVLVLVVFITSSDPGSLVIDSVTAGGRPGAPVPPGLARDRLPGPEATPGSLKAARARADEGWKDGQRSRLSMPADQDS